MTCPSCQRTNDPRRHYCGRCGANLAPVCRSCHFANSPEDRYCGGCGDLMTWEAAPRAAAPTPERRRSTAPPATIAIAAPLPVDVPPAIATITPKRSDVITAGDLAELLAAATAPPATVGLPETNIDQDDLDALFGSVP